MAKTCLLMANLKCEVFWVQVLNIRVILLDGLYRLL